MNRSAKDILFYSPKCPYSRGLLEKIQNTPVMNSIVPFNVHDPKHKIPGFVKAVPTLFLVQRREVLVNQALNQWVTQQIHMYTNSQINSGNIPGGAPAVPTGNMGNPNMMQNRANPGQQHHGPSKKPIMGLKDDLKGELYGGNHSISEFNPGEMSSSFSDGYSFLENDEAVASHGFAFIGDANDTPPVTSINTNNADLGDFPTQNNNSSGGSNQSLSYNPDPFADSGNTQPNYGGGQNLSYNPDPFANNTSTSNNRDTEKRKEFDKKFDEMMKEREISDALAGMNY
jgi:hypothetical protein